MINIVHFTHAGCTECVERCQPNKIGLIDQAGAQEACDRAVFPVRDHWRNGAIRPCFDQAATFRRPIDATPNAVRSRLKFRYPSPRWRRLAQRRSQVRGVIIAQDHFAASVGQRRGSQRARIGHTIGTAPIAALDFTCGQQMKPCRCAATYSRNGVGRAKGEGRAKHQCGLTAFRAAWRWL